MGDFSVSKDACKLFKYNTLHPILLYTHELSGLNGYTVITEILKTEAPILAFGEITIDDVEAILETGISGLAVSNVITQNFNTIRKFNQLLNASSTQEQRYTFSQNKKNNL
ncbi:beta/alpha barrel domain-containing protein [Arenibacter latericius]|uniref:hypothetical protein n=1 Tax=Arenibacter latericius TaxID=86104 RepID=UPI00040DCAA7|nr:hypothetical protein [Arenibacter latericius]